MDVCVCVFGSMDMCMYVCMYVYGPAVAVCVVLHTDVSVYLYSLCV